jgi:RNA polymerase sigma factor (sigma-70 family)
VLASIERALSRLANTYVFGYYDREDIEQEGRIAGLKSLSRYDPSRPLDNFIYVAIRNHFINLLRDKFRRNDPPCRACHEGLPCKYPVCERYDKWLRRNQRKSNLCGPQPFPEDPELGPTTFQDIHADVCYADLKSRIDQELPLSLRETYLQLLDGVPVPVAKREAVRLALKDLLCPAP